MSGVGILANVFLDSLERVRAVGVCFQAEASTVFGPVRCPCNWSAIG